MAPKLNFKRLLHWALISLGAGFASSAAASISILTHHHDDGRDAPAEIYVDGEIRPSITKQFVESLLQHKVQRGTVYLNSNGGDLQASMELGEFIRKNGFNTAIGRQGARYGKPLPGACQSACVMTFAGGIYRFADPKSYFGIHRFFSRTSGPQDLDLGQVLSAAITGYLIRMNVDPALFERMVSAGRGALQKLPVSDASKLNLVNNGLLPAHWQIVGKGGKVYLEGEQQTWIGTGRVQVSCRPGGISVRAQYDAEHNTQRIQREVKNYSLRLNNGFIGLDPAMIQGGVTIQDGFLTASFQPNPPMAQEIKSARSIGFAFHPREASLFYGFEIPASQHRELVSSFISHCVL